MVWRAYHIRPVFMLGCFSVTALCASAPAFAEAYCSGIPTAVLTERSGLVIARVPWRNQWVGICSIRGDWKDVPSDICWNWFAQISEAVRHKALITAFYPSAVTCDTMAIYGESPVAGYVRTEGPLP